MSWWLLLYLVGYGVFTAYWVRDDLRHGDSKAFLVTELVADVCLLLAALGFWLLFARSILGGAALGVFAAGLAGLVLVSVRELREKFPDPELPFHLNVATALSAVALFCVVYGPLIYWGFSFAVLGKTGGT